LCVWLRHAAPTARDIVVSVATTAEVERLLRERLMALQPAAWNEILRIFSMPSLERAAAIGAYWSYPSTRSLGELLIEIEADEVVRTTVARLFREGLRE
jgi:hypothetical protein